MDDPAIEARDLRVTFGTGARQVHAVDRVSFRVDAGETYGIVGESGSGKSTVLRAISGLLTQWRGEIRIAGRSVTARRDPASFRHMQMVFQDPYGSLHPRHNVTTTLLESIAIQRLDRGAERVAAVLAQVGLGPALRYRYPHQLSGGQRQRLAIARALILEPAVLLLDEPTSALDVSVQAEILNLLVAVRKARGITCILVSHDLSVVAHMCDRLGVMQHGRLIEEISVGALETGQASDPYTRELLRASRGYHPRERKPGPAQASTRSMLPTSTT